MKQKVSKKNKNSDYPVEFPTNNDGPIYHLLPISGCDNVESINFGNDNNWNAEKDSVLQLNEDLSPLSVGVADAQKLLLRLLLNQSKNENETNNPFETLSNTFLRQLSTSNCDKRKEKQKPTLRQQLACLRTFKNEILKLMENLKKKTEAGIETTGNRCLEKNKFGSSCSSAVLGLYRILFELCLSFGTPHAFKKAGYSCLSALKSYHDLIEEDGNDGICFKDLHKSIIDSIFYQSSDVIFWKQPVQTLFDAFTYEPVKEIILENSEYISLVLRLSLRQSSAKNSILKDANSTFYGVKGNSAKNSVGEVEDSDHLTANGVVGLDLLEAVEHALEICCTLKAIFTPIIHMKSQHFDSQNTTKIAETLVLYDAVIETLIKPLMYCHATSTDALIVGGVCYSQILFLKWNLESKGNLETLVTKAYEFFMTLIQCPLDSSDSTFKEHIDMNTKTEGLKEGLPNVMILKGFTSTLFDEILELPIRNIQAQNGHHIFFLERISSYMMALSQHSSNDAIRLWALKCLDTVMGRCKGIVLSSKSEGTIHEFLKQVVVLSNDILQSSLVIFDSPPCKQIGSAIPGLFKSLVNLIEVLDGKFEDSRKNPQEMKSMDVLAKKILMQPSSRKGKYVALDALLHKIGATKLLKMSEGTGSKDLVASFVNEIGNRGNSAGAVAELLGKILSLLREEMHTNAGIDLHRAGETKRERRRREKNGCNSSGNTSHLNDDIKLLPEWFNVWVPAFAEAMIDSKASRQSHISSYCLPLIITMVGGTGRKTDACHSFAALLNEISNGYYDNNDTMWAKLETIRHADLNKLFRSSLSSLVLSQAVSGALSLEQLKAALISDSPRVCVVAFQTLSILIPSFKVRNDPLQCVLLEVNLWKQSLPYACNWTEREHMISLNDALRRFLSHIADAEATFTQGIESSILAEFIDFVLNTLFLTQAYPGTTSQKESFSLRMFEIIISFASQNKLDKKTMQKRAIVQSDSRAKIVSALVCRDIFAALLSLHYSMWDATRMSAFASLCQLIALTKKEGLSLPSFFTLKSSRDLLLSRAFHLASSPRQRESDTGARLLAILCLTLSSPLQQLAFLKDLAMHLEERLKLMEKALGVVLNPEVMNINEKTTISTSSFHLPLAHGLIQALQLIINDVIAEKDLPNYERAFSDLAKFFCRAIEISLVVVADVKDDVTDLGGATTNDRRWKTARGNKSGSTPLNVNTGALGANATFASSNAVDDMDMSRRIITQRVLIGSWLLTKEACAGLSSVVTVFPGNIDANIMSTAGDLLISTLTTLKHQGAAFAAHKALQSISTRSFKEVGGNNLRSLPSIWSQRLLDEISCIEIVRDSTLRRSTGYGLGILSILRTEPTSGPRYMFQNVLSAIIRYSLPSRSKMTECMNKWQFSSPKSLFSYPDFIALETPVFIEDEEYQWKTRIHAQNILRLVILDAPLAVEMKKFVGDSLISALIGYSDQSWAIRNSATMTFTAAMLRVVDADKNAEANVKSSKNNMSGVNAISASELFRSYPSLAPVLLAMMKEERHDSIPNNSIHPVLFPLLLLLSRLQPLSMSQIDPSTDEISIMFVNPVISCLGHVHHKVRLVAARALNVLCTGDDCVVEKPTSRTTLITKCSKLLSMSNCKKNRCYNTEHGLLMALKCLIENSTSTNICFDTSLKNILARYASWDYFQATCPPVCAAIALDIWCCIHKSLGNDFSLSKLICAPLGRTFTILEVVLKIVKYVETITTSTHARVTVVGLASLASTAAKIAIEILYPHISMTSNLEQGDKFIKMISSLISSGNFDVMLHSVKSFKKKMWNLVEFNVNDSTKAFMDLKKVTLYCAGRIFIQSLQIILRRDGTSAHPPTLRRITRCILEITARYRGLSGDFKISQFADCSLYELFHQFSFMLTLDSKSDFTGTFVGNALELMALAISELRSEPNLTKHNRQVFEDDTRSFIDQVFKLSDCQTENWKLRLSAAVSIKESGILADAQKLVIPFIEQQKTRLYFRTMLLLQDSDEDVRREASFALFASDSDRQVSPLRKLEKGYDLMLENCSNGKIVFIVLTSQIISQIKDVNRTISGIIEEYDYSLRSSNLSEVQNLSSKRKIFEEEDTNAIEESLLTIHLSMQKILELTSTYNESILEKKGSFQAVCETCSKMLSQIGSIQCNGATHDIAHNCSWNDKLFGKIHGTLLLTSFSVYFYGIGMEEVGSAKKFRDSVKMIHPLIAEAINVLSEAKHNDDLTQRRLKKCCFLVPKHE